MMIDRRTGPTWDEACFLLRDYDGTATELFVIDLPMSQLSVVVSTLATLHDLELLTIGEEAVDPPVPFTSQEELLLQFSDEKATTQLLRSANGTPHHLQVYLFTDPKADSLDVEFVLWNDLTFPKHLDDSELRARLETLVRLATDCRAGVPDAACILSIEHNGDPRELLDSELAIVW